MAKKGSQRGDGEDAAGSLLKKAILLLGGLKQFLESMVAMLEKHLDRFQRRVLGMLVAYLGMAAGLFFLLAGIFFLLVDMAGIPRGVVFTSGGFLVLFISWIVVLVLKTK